MELIASIICSVLVSAIISKKIATHYFEIVDGYVRDICEKTNRSNDETIATLRKLQQNFGQEE